MNKLTYRVTSLLMALALTWEGNSKALASTTSHTALLTSNTYYVSTTGNDTNSGSITAPLKTFAKAASVLAPGDTLQVLPGTYFESLRFEVSGTSTAPITVIGNGAILNMQGLRRNGIKISGDYINLSNFEVTGATAAGVGILGKYITVENNILHDNVTENGIGTCGLSTSWSSALKVGVGGENIILHKNTVYNNCGEGIAVTRGVNVRVENNTAYDNFAPNIYIDNSPYTTVQNNLSYCTGTHLRLDGKRTTGIGLGEEYYSGWGAQLHDILISGNTIKDCRNGIAAFKSKVGGTLTNVTITENSVPSGQGRGIYLYTLSNQNVLISYNTLFNAIQLAEPEGVTLVGNIIIGTVSPTVTGISSPDSTVFVPTFTSTSPPPSATNTASPVASTTPTLTMTTTFTSTPSPVASNTPTQPASDFIFADGLERGNFSAWSAASTGGSDLIVTASAALVGSQGVQAVINDSTAMYVRDDSPNAEPHYRARFSFDPNSISMTSGDYIYILQGYATSVPNSVLRIEFKNNSGVYQVRARALNNSAAWHNTPYVTITDAPHVLEVDWVVGANTGSLTFWVDGIQQGSLTGIANDAYRMDSVRLGVPYLSITGTSGTMYFDAFESRRQTYIGP